MLHGPCVAPCVCCSSARPLRAAPPCRTMPLHTCHHTCVPQVLNISLTSAGPCIKVFPAVSSRCASNGLFGVRGKSKREAVTQVVRVATQVVCAGGRPM